MAESTGQFPLELDEGIGHNPERETLCVFGTNLVHDHLASIVKINDICNNLGLECAPLGTIEEPLVWLPFDKRKELAADDLDL